MTQIVNTVTYKYRLQPTQEQILKFREWQGISACVWNVTLGLLMRASKGKRIKSSKLGLNGYQILPHLKVDKLKKYTRIKSGFSALKYDVARAAIVAWDSWVAGVHKTRERPKFKSDKGPLLFKSIAGWYSEGKFKVHGQTLDVLEHRPLPSRPTTASISEDKNGRWWITFTVKRVTTPKSNERVIGVDVGVRDLFWTSEGFHVKAPRVNKSSLKKKYKLTSKLTKLKPGGNKYRKMKRRIENISRDVVQRQNDIEWRIANDLSLFKEVKMEDLKLLNMSSKGPGKRGLNNALRSVRLFALRQKIKQKGEESGNKHSLVNPSKTSITCPECRNADKKNRKGKHFRCLGCGFTGHADHVGAINIANKTPLKEKFKRTTGGSISTGKNRWSKIKAEKKLAEAQTGAGSDTGNQANVCNVGETPEVIDYRLEKSPTLAPLENSVI